MSTTTCGFCGSEYDTGLVSCPFCGGNSQIPDRALTSGTGLDGGKFTIVRVLGRGGFGITYEGYDETLHRTVAIKELFPEGAVRQGDLVAVPSIRQSAFQEERAQVVDEARRVASLKSSNIVEIYAAFQENDTVYIVMEFLSGHSLEHEINQSGSLKTDDVQAIALALCDALQAVHGQHMLHRDIKPANVMLTDEGRTVLIDFGAAREFVLHRTSQHTRLLTADYAAPEQYATEARFGPYTDIFSLGATLFHALSGYPPKNAIERSLNNETMVVLPDECQGPLGMAIQSCLHLRVDDRPHNIDAFRALLRTEVHATKKRWPNSRRWMFTAMAGITILLAVTIGRYSMSQRQSNLNLSPSVSFNTTATPTATHTSTPTNTPTPTRTSTATPAATPTKRPIQVPTPQPRVNTGANLRGGPGTDYPVIGGLAAGSAVEVVSRTESRAWLQLESGAWIAAFLIDDAPPNLPISSHLPKQTSVPTARATATRQLTAVPTPTSPTNVQSAPATPPPLSQAHMWVYLAEGDFALEVYVESGNPIPRGELDLFVNGTEFCNTSNLYPGMLQQLGCGWLEGGLSAQPQLWAEVEDTHFMECTHQGDEGENMVFACNYKPTPTSPTNVQSVPATPPPLSQAHMWVYLAEGDFTLEVYVESGNPIPRGELDLFVNGTEFCNTSNLYPGMLQQLGCGWLEGGLSAQPQVWAEVEDTHFMECTYRGNEDENMVFACNYKE